jgi:hypothetical protein
MGLRNQLSRLKKVSDAVGHEQIEEFFRVMQEHSGNPKVFGALDDLLCLIRKVEETMGCPITTQQWLNDDWLESKGLLRAINRLFREVHACTLTTVCDAGGER